MLHTEKSCELYPIYGIGPHRHEGLTSDPASFIGSTRMLPREEWPDNFVEDPAEGWDGCGTWYCPHDCDCSECPEGMVLGEDGGYWIPEQEPDDEDMECKYEDTYGFCTHLEVSFDGVRQPCVKGPCPYEESEKVSNT